MKFTATSGTLLHTLSTCLTLFLAAGGDKVITSAELPEWARLCGIALIGAYQAIISRRAFQVNPDGSPAVFPYRPEK